MSGCPGRLQRRIGAEDQQRRDQAGGRERKAAFGKRPTRDPTLEAERNWKHRKPRLSERF
jgi:hypothetical protein